MGFSEKNFTNLIKHLDTYRFQSMKDKLSASKKEYKTKLKMKRKLSEKINRFIKKNKNKKTHQKYTRKIKRSFS